MHAKTRIAAALGAAAVAGSVLTAVPASASPAAPYCGITWGSTDKTAGQLQQTFLRGVRAGVHPCFDRLVFDMGGGTGVGYRVGYRNHVYAEGSGFELSLAGGAKLRVVILGPARSGLNMSAANMVSVAGFPVLRQVRGGGSFEGQTTVGVGVRAKLPFRVFRATDADGHKDVVIDVARRWVQ
jgi:hypothetical protein